jgi:hypothetical protein
VGHQKWCVTFAVPRIAIEYNIIFDNFVRPPKIVSKPPKIMWAAEKHCFSYSSGQQLEQLVRAGVQKSSDDRWKIYLSFSSKPIFTMKGTLFVGEAPFSPWRCLCVCRMAQNLETISVWSLQKDLVNLLRRLHSTNKQCISSTTT